jgi:uncharacterized protein YdeI (YjbR/CyaY-like superfamily)
MGTRDARVDAYIEKSAEFAQPILRAVREIVHEGCPETEETIKWGLPHFDYKGMLCSMAAFKEHCAFGFWKSRLVLADARAAGEVPEKESMGSFGRLTSLKDLPPKRKLIGYIRKAMELNDAKIKSPVRSKPRPPRPALPVPEELTAALKKSKKAQATFAAFPPSHRREYIEWITEAKTDATRQRRIDTAIEWLTEGKSRNWKYQRG